MSPRALILALAGAAAALVAAPSSADAECGGGGGSSSSSSSSSDSNRGSEPSCVEVSPVVGYSTCRRFGEWDAGHRPPLSIHVGTSFHRLGPGGIDVAASANHPDMDSDATFRLVSEEGGAGFVGGTIDLQALLAISPNAYVGVEAQFGKLTSGPVAARETDMALSVEPSSVLYTSAAAVAGARINVGDFNLRGEIAAGVELLAIGAETRHADCELVETVTTAALSVKPRAIIERWVSPWVTVGAGVGSNLLRRGDVSATLFLGGHLRAFDGGR